MVAYNPETHEVEAWTNAHVENSVSRLNILENLADRLEGFKRFEGKANWKGKNRGESIVWEKQKECYYVADSPNLKKRSGTTGRKAVSGERRTVDLLNA